MISELPSVCFEVIIPLEKAFCVFRFSQCKSAVIIQCDFRKTYETEVQLLQTY